LARIGILGGTFNPPHNGHLAVAAAGIDQLELEKLLVVPAKDPPHKEVEADPGPEVRLELCRAAFAGIDGVAVSRVEIEREGPSWTADTLVAVATDYPDDDLLLILGEDAALSLPSWKQPEVVVGLAQIAWVVRGGIDGQGSVEEVVESLGGTATPVRLEMAELDVSSTEIRERAADGVDFTDLAPLAVATMISELGLYHRKSV
jgi:nicotinate-nucleotide adenylyltransferase